MHGARNISLELEDVSLSRGEQPLVSDLSLTVQPGEALWLTGPNGVGKTTILLACAGLIAADSGRIEWTSGAQPVSPQTALAYAAHNGPERSGLTLGEELRFWKNLYGDQMRLYERLSTVGLTDRQDTPVAGLSAGQRRRLSLARLLSSGRKAWLLDEPLSGLDTEGRDLVTKALSSHLSTGGLALIASHQPVPIIGVEARKLVLERGQ